MNRYIRMFTVVKLCILGCVLPPFHALAGVRPTLGEMHAPVVATLGKQQILVQFLQNNLKNRIGGEHVAHAEIFYTPINFTKPQLNYVWKVEGDEIASVFFYEWKSSVRLGKTMYVLTRSRLSNGTFEGFSYSLMELPIIKDGDNMSLAFFPGDAPDPVFEGCNVGRNLKTGQNMTCAYDDADSIKKYFATQDR